MDGIDGFSTVGAGALGGFSIGGAGAIGGGGVTAGGGIGLAISSPPGADAGLALSRDPRNGGACDFAGPGSTAVGAAIVATAVCPAPTGEAAVFAGSGAACGAGAAASMGTG
ncbi:MAG: hypothetical protein ABJE95_07680, partial [Byssovorax sp.]